MGFKYRRTIGGKNIKMNISKKGISSFTIKPTKNISYNTKSKNITVNSFIKGLSFIFGNNKKK